MSKTPRTDALAQYVYGPTEFVPAAFARKLELELNQTSALLEQLKNCSNCGWDFDKDDCPQRICYGCTRHPESKYRRKISQKDFWKPRMK